MKLVSASHSGCEPRRAAGRVGLSRSVVRPSQSPRDGSRLRTAEAKQDLFSFCSCFNESHRLDRWIVRFSLNRCFTDERPPLRFARGKVGQNLSGGRSIVTIGDVVKNRSFRRASLRDSRSTPQIWISIGTKEAPTLFSRTVICRTAQAGEGSQICGPFFKCCLTLLRKALRRDRTLARASRLEVAFFPYFRTRTQAQPVLVLVLDRFAGESSTSTILLSTSTSR
jgi:hypothetical protein